MQSRAALCGLLLFCIYGALSQFVPTPYIGKSVPPLSEHDPFLIISSVFAIFIEAAIAIRSPFVGDRVVFGGAAAATLLRLMIRLASPNPSTKLLIAGFASFAWTVAAVGVVLIFVSVSRSRRTGT